MPQVLRVAPPAPKPSETDDLARALREFARELTAAQTAGAQAVEAAIAKQASASAASMVRLATALANNDGALKALAAAVVEAQKARPTADSWDMEIVSRDSDGRVKKMRFTRGGK